MPEHVSAVLLWRCRPTSSRMQAVIWTAIGLGFGALARPLLEVAHRATAPARTATVARRPRAAL